MTAVVGNIRASLVATWALFAFVACADDAPRRPTGSTCTASNQCETGICGGGGCLSAEGDDDLDGLTNQVEAALGSNPTSADTDADGLDDLTETRGGYEVDSDADGKPDVLESMLTDKDGDCIPDQIDARDDVFDVELSGLVPLVCRTEGVCAGAILIVSCDGGKGPRCEYSAVARFEAAEVTCDGRDNDCNGLVDEGQPDRDFDQIADCVDPDRDGDGVVNDADTCPDNPDPEQADSDGDGTGDACDAPGDPRFIEASPLSPSNVRRPTLTFGTEPSTTIDVFANAGCGSDPIASAVAPAGGGGQAVTVEVAATVPANLVTRLSARARNQFSLTSSCVAVPLYSHDDVPPAAPIFVSASPASPSRLRRPTITVGTAGDDKISDIALHLSPGCAGIPDFEGPLDAAGNFSFTTEVAPNTELLVFGTARDEAGNVSACAEVARWRHDTVAPCDPRLADGVDAFALLDADVQLIGEPNGSIDLFNDPACSRGLATATRVGSGEIPYDSCRALWRASVRLPETEPLEAYARATDAAGNVGACAPLGTLRYDKTPPAAPVLLELKATVWHDDAVVFSGRGGTEAGAEVELFVGPTAGVGCDGSPRHSARADDQGLFVFPLSLGDDSPRWLRLRARDAAGNVSVCGDVEPLVGDVTIIVPPLAGPSSLLVSDENGGIIEEMPLITDGLPTPAPRTLTRRIVRGASVSLAHRPAEADLDIEPDYILSQMDVRPEETLTFGRGWFASSAPSPLLHVVADIPSGANSHIVVVGCQDGHWADIEVRSALPFDVQVPPGCLVADQTTTLVIRPTSSSGPTATATFVATADANTAQDVQLGTWRQDADQSLTLAGVAGQRGSGLAILVGGPALSPSPTAPQFWLEMTREYLSDGSDTEASISLPSLAPAGVPAQSQMVVVLDFDLFERIRVVSLPVPAAVGAAQPRVELATALPASEGLFTVRLTGAGEAAVSTLLFPPSGTFTVTGSFVEVRWNALGTGGRPLVWQVVQSSQRTTTRFPDLPGAPSLLASLRPPTLPAAERGDLDRATRAIYGFADNRPMTSARGLLASELFHGNLPGPPVLPRPVAYQSSIAPGRFLYD